MPAHDGLLLTFLATIVAGFGVAVATKPDKMLWGRRCHIFNCHAPPSAQLRTGAGHPVRRGLSAQSQPSRCTGSPGQAGR
ncbi:hypothetical protein BJA5080_01898 [Bradyrhizobium diazoefficiens SEMIA 5080]|uniref:Uncharacterized protein n=1 Tax=Bradyrhizobium diazoefficiens SEMIA 5080 TaxID=754504 RepID=A0A837C912_9BRAD|nr:hypothetical protein BJA5080_01898 [Bradyrhizobium diazoefficiens SEMIA 5080]